MNAIVRIADLQPRDRRALGELMVDVYSRLPGFPSPEEQPDYYATLRDIGRFAEQPGVRVLAAHDAYGVLAGGVVYFGDMAHYGADGLATTLKHSAGIRLLGVSQAHRGSGAGKALTLACLDLARGDGHAQVVLHTTRAMQAAWAMYERLGFRRWEALDFLQQGFPVYGFRLALSR